MVHCMRAVKSVIFLADFYVVFLRGPVLLIYILIGGKGFGRGRYKFCCCCHNLPSCQRYEIPSTRYYIPWSCYKLSSCQRYEILATPYYISGPAITCHPARDTRFLLHTIIFLVLP
jgi:hypothetical protein